MDFDGNIKALINISDSEEFKKLQQAVLEYDFLSDPTTGKLNPVTGAYKDSRTIQVTPNTLSQTLVNDVFKVDLDYNETTKKLQTLAADVLKLIEPLYPDHVLVKGHFVGLLPAGSQKAHIDIHYHTKFASRIVIAVTNNGQSKLIVGDEEYYLEPGQLYEFNNQRPHCSYNNGNTVRTCLFFDLLPNQMLDDVLNNYKLFPSTLVDTE